MGKLYNYDELSLYQPSRQKNNTRYIFMFKNISKDEWLSMCEKTTNEKEIKNIQEINLSKEELRKLRLTFYENNEDF
jgi:predicted DNA-binding protein (UPF0251 family)